MQFTDQFVAEIILLILVPVIAGPLVTRAAGARARRGGATPAKVRALESVITIAWVAIAAVGVSVTLGTFSFLSTLTFSAIGGVAVALALQTVLQNFVSGLILLQNRFLRVGDVVQFSGLKGTVTALGPVTTVLRLEDGSLAFVSNANLLSGPLVNLSAAKRLAGEY